MRPTAQQVETGARALSCCIPDPSAAYHEQIARAVLTPVLSAIEDAIGQLGHDEHCPWWHNRPCTCLADVLAIIHGERQ